MDHSFTKKLFLAAKSELFVCWREEKGFISVWNLRNPELDGKCVHLYTLWYTEKHQNRGCSVIFIQLRYQSDILNKEKLKNRKKNFGPPRPPGASPKGPHILARGWNIKKRLDNVIFIPIKVVYAKFHPIWPSSFLWARFGFENR